MRERGKCFIVLDECKCDDDINTTTPFSEPNAQQQQQHQQQQQQQQRKAKRKESEGEVTNRFPFLIVYVFFRD
jgi:hypothetical protein